MSTNLDLTGVHVPLITPLEHNGDVALPALTRLAHEVLDAGAAGLVALSTTAEVATLDPAERQAVLQVFARVCRERGARLTVGVGSNDTRASVQAVGALADLPEATAALVVVPYYNRPTEDGVVAHFAAVAKASPVPVLVYHVPYRTGRSLGAATLSRLAELPGVVGMKLASGGVDADVVEFMAARPAEFSVLAGDDPFLLPVLALGGVGGVLASAHLRTEDFAAVIAAANAGDLTTHRDLALRLATLAGRLFAEPNPSVVKGVLHAQGRIPSPALRLPMQAASAPAVAQAMAALG